MKYALLIYSATTAEEYAAMAAATLHDQDRGGEWVKYTQAAMDAGVLLGAEQLEPVLASGALDGYSPLHAAHAALLDQAGFPERARDAWARAAETSASPALREELLRRHEGCPRLGSHDHGSKVVVYAHQRPTIMT
jgi:hypothetical protein